MRVADRARGACKHPLALQTPVWMLRQEQRARVWPRPEPWPRSTPVSPLLGMANEGAMWTDLVTQGFRYKACSPWYWTWGFADSILRAGMTTVPWVWLHAALGSLAAYGNWKVASRALLRIKLRKLIKQHVPRPFQSRHSSHRMGTVPPSLAPTLEAMALGPTPALSLMSCVSRTSCLISPCLSFLLCEMGKIIPTS